MNESEIDKAVSSLKWASIMTVREDGRPYAIEATPFMMDGQICFMINPNGTTKKNLDHADKVLLKFTATSKDLDHWLGVSCQGTGKFIRDSKTIGEGWALLGKVMGADYTKAAEKFMATPERSPMLAVSITEKTGRCSASAGQALPDILG
ncbi:MAG: hypothetical protein LBE31_08725 [Deltaproteobacteria bacterium]|nr:hypothetical protein [Deltaproteobacteria bacterium]